MSINRSVSVHFRSWKGFGAVLLFIPLLLASCASAPPAAAPLSDRDLQWPAVKPRIAWVRSIRDYHDASIRKGFWKRFAEFFTGEPDTHIGKPYGVLSDEQQRLFIADVSQARLHVMDSRENAYSVIGEGILRSPIGIAMDDAENLYITDSGAGTIYRYSLRRQLLEPFVVYDFGRPTGIAYNRVNQLLYVSNTTEHQVAAYDVRGKQCFSIGRRGDGPGQFNFPTDLFVDEHGLLYVTDSLNSRISIFSPQGAYLKSFGSPGDSGGSFAKPKGVAVDSKGNIYVCDALLDAVQIFNDRGDLLLTFGSNGTANGQFWMPAGIYIDRNDTIFVADSYNRRIQVFKYLDAGDASPGQEDNAADRQTADGTGPSDERR
ncbi:6-bladed beta-propeller [Geobacter sp. SVR]|uniref:6-bladed beta-propeller n=1 Tax=Geobacter sp. SVR TaxID=2495594 RepID=UPI00143EFDC2|nr:6-bladed beta-propeller [Geobacter sp. SVR]BCS53271.1 hypothetical protein GSVR_15790 [Geobacter sp. SVR]GCF85603.1 hypothetical protein GSbR_22030 [Geobacter sp. SVR]